VQNADSDEMMMSDQRDPFQFIPLRPAEFEVLLVLTGGEAHGYGIIKEAEARIPGKSRMDTGTLYRTLARLTAAGMVEPLEERPVSDTRDERRRYYAITPFGRSVAAAEARRLAAQLKEARALDLLTGLDGREERA
jgi:DNA-binding PadR family transcriptional regulator